MKSLCDKLQTIGDGILSDTKVAYRQANSVQLLAVSKHHPAAMIQAAYGCGQRAFGENYVQEMQYKVEALQDLAIEWHFIGALQSNKTRFIAEQAMWLHTLDRLKIAQRLSQQRPDHLPPLSVCLQVNISEESSKSGVFPEEITALAKEVVKLPRLRLRGLMVIPKPQTDINQQRATFAKVRQLQEQLNQQLPTDQALDTLSMGMSGDCSAAIAEGATLVRIGTAIFGKRVL
ncbi:MAG: YggS family pyridoxal phosphate-dependent enzyme [Cocleimonas sp.]|nr:YggS family pyridoxal phosphate-dependent enzyme [Cocleimonas sp.]